MIKLSDYVFKYLSSVGVRHAFMLAGGGIMHLMDSLGRSGVSYVCCQHEQTASIAAQAYDMYKEELSVCLVTTGPGGTNALTGAAAAYVDSTPVIYMSGQVKRADFASLRGVRQFGAQENDIVSMARPVTKYAVTVMEPETIAEELEKCVWYAVHGRKGPVWIDIPLDIQAAMIDEDILSHFEPGEKDWENNGGRQDTAEQEAIIERAAAETLSKLRKSERPLLLVGQGMISSGSAELVREFAKSSGIPVMATWRALDFMDSESEDFYGSPGLQAPRYSNLILQHCDMLLVLGSRLDNMITAFNEEHFAFRAEKVIVDIDANEIKKLGMTKVYPVEADIKPFMEKLLDMFKRQDCYVPNKSWKSACLEVRKRFPILKERQEKEEGVNLYRVTWEISKYGKPEDVIVISSTSRCNTAGHIAFNHREGQKTISSMGMGSMGFALPSVIGAHFASDGRRVIMIEGDGSLQLNIQELVTVKANRIDAKMFIFNNSGYAAIATMQERNFAGYYVGSNSESGLHMPDMEKIAFAYGIPYYKIESNDEIEEKVKKTMYTDGPVICDIRGALSFDEIPKCISRVDDRTGQRVSAFLENPYPFLEDSELEKIEGLLLGRNN